jgi:hypothetical protein
MYDSPIMRLKTLVGAIHELPLPRFSYLNSATPKKESKNLPQSFNKKKKRK